MCHETIDKNYKPNLFTYKAERTGSSKNGDKLAYVLRDEAKEQSI